MGKELTFSFYIYFITYMEILSPKDYLLTNQTGDQMSKEHTILHHEGIILANGPEKAYPVPHVG